ncbi:MAG: alpha/beta hydrolase [Gemmataceae bacterium]
MQSNHEIAPLSLAECIDRFNRQAHRSRFFTGRYHLSYYVWGQGPPLLFIHGAADVGRSFLMTIAHLQPHFQCIAYDLPGQRGDGARLARYRHSELVADLLALIDHLRLDQAAVLGSSFGGTIALRALQQAPQRFTHGILQGGLVYRPLKPLEWWLAWVARWLPGPTGRLPRREKILRAVHGEPFAGRDPEWWRAYVDWTGAARIATLGHQGRLLHQLDLRDELPRIWQPVLVVAGDRDHVAPLPHARLIHEKLPHSHLVILNGCGHVPAYTHPEKFASVIREFLTRTKPAAAPSLS